MDFNSFMEIVRNNIKYGLPEEYRNAEVEIHPIVKLNETYQGLTVNRGEMIVPTINLNAEYELFSNGTYDMQQIMKRIAGNITEHSLRVDVSNINDYTKAREFLFIKTASLERNREALQSIPYTAKEDLAITYHIRLPKEGGNEEGTPSVTVTNDLMRYWNITQETLHKDAMENSVKMLPARVATMQEMLFGMLEAEMFGMPGAIIDVPPSPLHVVTNTTGSFGAAALFYEGVLDQISERMQDNIYILPSSVHEMLVLPESEAADVDEMRNMVTEINATQVSPEERLTDEVYHYDSKAKLFEKAEVYLARIEGREVVAQAGISFFVTDNMDDPAHGNTRRNLSLPEAFEAYQKIDIVTSKVRGIGFELRDGSKYQAPFPLMEENRMLTENLDRVAHFRESPLVQKAVSEMRSLLGASEVKMPQWTRRNNSKVF